MNKKQLLIGIFMCSAIIMSCRKPTEQVSETVGEPITESVESSQPESSSKEVHPVEVDLGTVSEPEFVIENDDVKVAPYKNLGIDISKMVKFSGEKSEGEKTAFYIEAMLDRVVAKSVLLNETGVDSRVETDLQNIYEMIAVKGYGADIDTVEAYCKLFRITPADESGLEEFVKKRAKEDLKKKYVVNAIMEKEGIQLTKQWLEEISQLLDTDVESMQIMGEEYQKEVLVGQFIYDNN